MAVQVDPSKPTSKAPGTKQLKLKLLSICFEFAFKFKLRHYNVIMKVDNRADEFTANERVGNDGYCSPRHRMPRDSMSEVSSVASGPAAAGTDG